MTDTPTIEFAPLPRIWRHQNSGVWIGHVLGRSTLLPNHVLFRGRRIWSWSGGRLECSQLATVGCRAGDRLGDWTLVEIAIDGSIEILPTTDALVEAARLLPVCRCDP